MGRVPFELSPSNLRCEEGQSYSLDDEYVGRVSDNEGTYLINELKGGGILSVGNGHFKSSLRKGRKLRVRATILAAFPWSVESIKQDQISHSFTNKNYRLNRDRDCGFPTVGIYSLILLD